MKRIATGILLFLSVLFCAVAAGCDDKPKILDAPQNLRVEDNVLIWDEVEHASGYAVYIVDDDREEETKNNYFDFSSLENYEPFDVEVLAVGDGADYLDSDWVRFSCTLTKPFDPTYGLAYELTADGTGYIASKRKYEKPVTGKDPSDYYIYIPDSYEGLPVKEIGCFYRSVKHTTALTVRMPATIEKIGDNAFLEFTSLRQIEIPEGVTSIGSAAFSCTALTQIKIPESLTSIGSAAFGGCTSLTQVEIPESATSIGDAMFRNCTSLRQIEIPEHVASIGEEAFKGCTSLRQIEIPEHVASIGDSAFQNCISLPSVSFPSALQTIGVSAFEGCTSLSDIQMSEGLKTIGSWAFACTSPVNVKFPEGVSIRSVAFESCKKLKSVEFPEDVSIRGEVFRYCTALTDIKFPSDPNTYDPQAFASTGWYRNQPDGYVTVNGDTLFHYKGDIPNGGVIENFPSGITKIAGKAFSRIELSLTGSNIVSIEIPDGVQFCGNAIFALCESLKHIKLPGGLTEIPASTFSSCKVLESIEIPEGVTSIKAGAFSNCLMLADIKFPSTLETIEKGAFMNCNLTKLYLPEGLKNLDTYSFSGVKAAKFEEIILPVTLNSIPANNLFTDGTLIYYRGTKEQWDEYFAEADFKGTLYYFSDNPPDGDGNYWHFDTDGVTPVIWS